MDPPQPPGGLTTFLVFWLTAVGGAVGSFLNVVVYRLPAGKSLSHPGSHCPHCKQPIRWHDNIPVFGWLMIGGRCRDCRQPVAPRYPLVEAWMAALFCLLAVAEVADWWLPSVPNPTAGVASIEAAGASSSTAQPNAPPLDRLPPLPVQLASFALHATVLATLTSAALIAHDRHAVPPKLFIPAGFVVFAAPLAWPAVHPVATVAGLSDGQMASRLLAVFDVLVGAAVAIGCAWLSVRMLGRNDDLARRARRGWYGSAAIVGGALGWQAGIVIVLAAGSLALAGWSFGAASPKKRRSSRAKTAPSAEVGLEEAAAAIARRLLALLLCTVAFLPAWGWLVRVMPVLSWAPRW